MPTLLFSKMLGRKLARCKHAVTQAQTITSSPKHNSVNI